MAIRWRAIKVYASYMEKILRRAVGYAGALIDYFYRGTIELTLPAKGTYAITAPGGGFNEIRVKARNTTATGEEMTNGTFQLVVRYSLALEDPFQSSPVAIGPRQYQIVPEKNGVSRHLENHPRRAGLRPVRKPPSLSGPPIS